MKCLDVDTRFCQGRRKEMVCCTAQTVCVLLIVCSVILIVCRGFDLIFVSFLQLSFVLSFEVAFENGIESIPFES